MCVCVCVCVYVCVLWGQCNCKEVKKSNKDVICARYVPSMLFCFGFQ